MQEYYLVIAQPYHLQPTKTNWPLPYQLGEYPRLNEQGLFLIKER